MVIGTRLKRAGMHWTVKEPTPSSPSAAANSVDALRISGSAAPISRPHDFTPKSDVRPKPVC